MQKLSIIEVYFIVRAIQQIVAIIKRRVLGFIWLGRKFYCFLQSSGVSKEKAK